MKRDICELREQGTSFRAIAVITGVSLSLTHYYAGPLAGVGRCPRHGPKPSPVYLITNNRLPDFKEIVLA